MRQPRPIAVVAGERCRVDRNVVRRVPHRMGEADLLREEQQRADETEDGSGAGG